MNVSIEGMNDFGNKELAIDWGEVDDTLIPIQQRIVSKFTWQLPPGDPSGWSFRTYSQAIGYGSRTGQLSKPSRELQFAWDSLGLLASA